MVSEEFSTILKKEQLRQLIPFLKSLEKSDKKEIASLLKPLAKEYLDYLPVTPLLGTTTYKQKATPSQVNILYAAAFVCLNRKDYQKFDRFGHMLNNKILDDILPWYCPDWFSDSINDLTKRDWIPWNFGYKDAMALAEKGHLNPSDELIVKLIPQMIFEQDAKHKFLYLPQQLRKRPITLEKHIWLIFQFETTINYSDRYHQFQNANKDERLWITALKQCSNDGLLDRQRLLRESILATGRNFNKALSGWFVELFEFLEPTEQELITLQPELFNVLSSQQSKAINSALNSLKKIVEEKEFNAVGFLENAPILLSCETKSVVSSTLLLFEKILRKNASLKEEICIATCQAFIHNDENIQNKASKLLLKCHDDSLRSVTEEITKYADSMLMTSKKILSDFLAVTPKQQEDNITDTSESNEAIGTGQEITSLDELIFLASQAFDNNDPLHIDLLPAALVKLQDQITGSVLHKFEPALQRAYSFVMNDWPSTMGYLDHLLATFFLDLTNLLIDRFPTEGSSLKQIHVSFQKKDAESKAKWSWYNSRILNLPTWSVHSRDTTYIIHKAILLIAYEKIKNADHLSILSTPTHEHGYLDPMVLVNRLELYQGKTVLPDNYDFQLAISRVAPFNHDEALKEARKTLKGEVLQIMEFLLDKDEQPRPPFNTPSLWFMAGVTKSPQHTYPEFDHFFYATLPKSTFTGDVPWRSFVEHYKTTRYNYEKRTPEEVTAQHNVLRLTLNPYPSIWQEPEEKKESVLSKLTSLISTPKKARREDTFIQHEYLSLKTPYIAAEHNDIQRFIYLFPSNPNPVLTLVAHRALVHSTLASENDKKILTRTLEAIIHLKFDFSEITHLFIATCMLTSDKTVRSFAAEMWIQGVNNGKINNEQTGKIIGIHFSSGYAPLKRFTDLVSSNLLKISQTHNIELEAILTAVIENLPTEPPVGTKRLLELYSEVLALNNASVASNSAKQRLASWTASSGLKKLISSLPV
ncbi:MAG TPA: DUF6493 family protein [Cyclobacteriaceae bacterium]|nr:DUF6493 family protein [Cyclobacteriaceae bacterium]